MAVRYYINVTEFKKTAATGAPLMPDVKQVISGLPSGAISSLENGYLDDISSSAQLAAGEVTFIQISAREV